jgi:hypothetical protein
MKALAIRISAYLLIQFMVDISYRALYVPAVKPVSNPVLHTGPPCIITKS